MNDTIDSPLLQVTDSGFLGTVPTISASRIGDDALIQVYLAPSLVRASIRYYGYLFNAECVDLVLNVVHAWYVLVAH